MSKQRENVQVKTLPISTSDYNRHFLPTLSPYKSLPHSSQNADRDNALKTALRLQGGTLSSGEDSEERKKISGDGHTEATQSSVGSKAQIDSILTDPVPNPAMVNLDLSEKKKDRKSQARRHLVEGLSSNHQRYNGPNRRTLYRSQTFNQASDVTASQRSPSMRLLPKSKADPAYTQRDKSNNAQRNGVINTSLELTDRTKAAIENWNEFILELRANPYAQASKINQLSVLSDSSSSDEFLPYPLSSKIPNQSFYGSKSLFTNTGSGGCKSMSIISSNQKLTGLGFSRYRPITPNLLEKLDKLKLSSRKKTQRWINQLEVQRRSYNTATKVVQENDCADNSVGNNLEDGSTKDTTCSGSRVDTLKPLRRSDSYDSSRTRLSSFAHTMKKTQTDFL